MQRIFYQSPLARRGAEDRAVIYAADFGTASRPATAPATRPAPARRYTPPGGAARQMSFLAALTASTLLAAPDAGTQGLEAAQSSVGRPGLSASVQAGVPGSGVGVQSVGRRGLQQGAPLGGGLGVNIFTPRANPLDARCEELVGAGFFGDVAACRARFSR